MLLSTGAVIVFPITIVGIFKHLGLEGKMRRRIIGFLFCLVLDSSAYFSVFACVAFLFILCGWWDFFFF